MKKTIIFTVAIAALTTSLFTSCKKDNQPAITIAGDYSGSFEGEWMEDDTLTSSGYAVNVAAVNDNKVKVSGNNFETFEVLVTSNGLNVEPVSQSDPYLLDFIFIGDENKLKFTFNKGENKAKYIGVK